MPCDPSVLIAIATYRRPLGLARLLDALTDLRPVPGVPHSVLVLDNSAEGSALEYARARMGGFPVPLAVEHVPEKGLSQVRNTALRRAIAAGVTHLGFLDDDEVPGENWLCAHLQALRLTGAAASVGRVVAAYQAPPARWISSGRFLDVDGPRNHAEMAHGIGGNIVFSLDPVRRAGLSFDPAFDVTGGEDTAFFDRYIKTGARIIYAEQAAVREEVPASRARLRWLWRRWRRSGQTSARVRFPGGVTAAFTCAGSGLARVVLGAIYAFLMLPLAPLGHPAWARGVRISARGAGYLDAACGRYTQEYAAPERS